MHSTADAHGPLRYARPMTEELFREDAALDTCDARITARGEAGIQLDRTVFYPQGGGQAGDRGELGMADGRVLAIADAKKGAAAGAILHLPAPGQEALLAALAVGTPVQAAINRARRGRQMRFHTATHLLYALARVYRSIGRCCCMRSDTAPH